MKLNNYNKRNIPYSLKNEEGKKRKKEFHDRELKRRTLVPRTNPRYPADYPHGLPYNQNQPHLLLRRKRHKPTSSTCSIKQPSFSFHRLPLPSLFFFICAPLFIGHQSGHCFHNGRSISAVEYSSFSSVLSVCHGHQHLLKSSSFEPSLHLGKSRS